MLLTPYPNHPSIVELPPEYRSGIECLYYKSSQRSKLIVTVSFGWSGFEAAFVLSATSEVYSGENQMAFALQVPLNLIRPQQQQNAVSLSRSSKCTAFARKQRCTLSISATLATPSDEKQLTHANNLALPIMVNSCMGKMGEAVIEAGISAGLHIVPASFGIQKDAGKTVEVGGKNIQVYGPSERETALASIVEQYQNLIVVDFTVPNAVNENAELYCKSGVPFVMGTTGGDRDLLYKTVQDANLYAVISPQMGKQVVAFLAAMDIMSKQFPGAFSGYTLEVLESHQATKLDTSGTAKAVISCFQKLGVDFDIDQVQLIRDPKQQVEMVGVPEEHLNGHAFHMYHLTSPDGTVSFEFQHNVCGRSIYAEGAIDAALFLAKKIQSKADKKIYDMIDVLREALKIVVTKVHPPWCVLWHGSAKKQVLLRMFSLNLGAKGIHIVVASLLLIDFHLLTQNPFADAMSKCFFLDMYE
ncbi:dihydrodipicolinate reductase [Tanacetum coccineum]